MYRERPEQEQTLVVIGNGMVSWKLCQRLVEHGVHESIRIVVFGEEPRPAYDRVHLTSLLSHEVELEEGLILSPKEWYAEHGIELHLGDPVVEVDRPRSRVISQSGVVVEYNRLVFATGSRPFVPPIEGVDLPGVFLYRDIPDVYRIEEYSQAAKRVVIIGGGILGLEAAKAIFDVAEALLKAAQKRAEGMLAKARAHTMLEVHVIEHGAGLMHRQIDQRGADLLKEMIEARHVKVQVHQEVVRIAPDDEYGTDRLILHFVDGSTMMTDMVLISAGVRPRSELAQAAELPCAPNGGIIVDDRLQTADEQIYAIGDCAAHKGTSYGLVLPGYQMVDVVVANLLGGDAKFEGGDRSAKLKFLGVTVAALGEYDGDSKALTSALRYPSPPDPKIKVYRKLVTRNGRLIGAVTVGDWDNLDRIRDALRFPVPTSFWDMRRFRATGNLWPRDESLKVADWAPDALVCGCMQVTRGTLSHAITGGCATMAELGRKTNAGSMCGSCKPLLEELLGVDDGPKLPVSIGISIGIGNVPIQDMGAKRDAAPRSRRAAELGPMLKVSERGSPQLPPASVRGGSLPASARGSSGPASVRGGSGPASVRGGTKDAWGAPQSKRGSMPATKRAKRSLPMAGSAPKTQRSSVPPPADEPRTNRASVPPPPSGRPSSPPSQPVSRPAPATRPSRPPGRVSTPPPARHSTPPPMMFSAVQLAAEVEEEAPVSVRRPSVGPQSRRVQRAEPRTQRGVGLQIPIVEPPDEIPPTPVVVPEPPPPKRSSIPPALEIAPDPTLIDIEEQARAAAGLDKIAQFALPELEKRAASSRPPPPAEEAEEVEAALVSEDIVEVPPAAAAEASPEEAPESQPAAEEAPTSSTRWYDEDENYDEEEEEEYDGEDDDGEGLGVAMPDRAVSAGRRSWVPPARISQPSPPRQSRPAAQAARERGLTPLFIASIVGFLASAGLFIGPLLVERFLHKRSWLAMLGDDPRLKQITGYGMVGLLLVSLLLTVRKRWKRFTVSGVDIFRMIHGIVAASTLLLLAVHTGLQLGKRMIFMLSIDFLAASVLGAVAGVIAALSPMWAPVVVRNRRLVSLRAHLILCLPLPVLIILHVLQIYYY